MIPEDYDVLSSPLNPAELDPILAQAKGYQRAAFHRRFVKTAIFFGLLMLPVYIGCFLVYLKWLEKR